MWVRKSDNLANKDRVREPRRGDGRPGSGLVRRKEGGLETRGGRDVDNGPTAASSEDKLNLVGSNSAAAIRAVASGVVGDRDGELVSRGGGSEELGITLHCK